MPRRKKLNVDKILDDVKKQPELELEKNDLKAIIIAAFLVLLPILLIFIGVVLGIYWLFFGRITL